MNTRTVLGNITNVHLSSKQVVECKKASCSTKAPITMSLNEDEDDEYQEIIQACKEADFLYYNGNAYLSANNLEKLSL